MGYLDENGLVYAWRRIREYIDDKLLSNYDDFPKASTTEYGICKIGQGLRVVDGVVSNNYTVGIASSDDLGLIKVGNTLEISNEGVLNVTHKANLYDEPRKYIQSFVVPTLDPQHISLYEDYDPTLAEKLYFVSANVLFDVPKEFKGATYNVQINAYTQNSDNELSEKLQCCDEILLPETTETSVSISHSISGFLSVYFNESIDAGISLVVTDANALHNSGPSSVVISELLVVPVNLENVNTQKSDDSLKCDFDINCSFTLSENPYQIFECQLNNVPQNLNIGDYIYGSLQLDDSIHNTVYNSKFNNLLQIAVPGGIIPLKVVAIDSESSSGYLFDIAYDKVNTEYIEYPEIDGIPDKEHPYGLNISKLPGYYRQSENFWNSNFIKNGIFSIGFDGSDLVISYESKEESSIPDAS